MIRFLTFTVIYDVCCQGGSVQWQLSQGTGKIGGYKSFRDFFQKHFCPLLNRNNNNKISRQPPLENLAKRILEMEYFSHCLLYQQAQKPCHGNVRAKEGPVSVFVKFPLPTSCEQCVRPLEMLQNNRPRLRATSQFLKMKNCPRR